jgi:hypothetical protein
MAIGPIGSKIFTNQNTTAAATKQINFQNRLEMQNLMASAFANEKSKVVQEIRPTEESHKIDPERDHHDQRREEEEGGAKKDMKNPKEYKGDDDLKPTRRLDITI